MNNDPEYIIGNIDISMSKEDIPLTAENKEEMWKCLEGKIDLDELIADWRAVCLIFAQTVQSLARMYTGIACDLYVSAFYAEKKGKEPLLSSVVPTSSDVQRASSGLEESH